MAVLHGRFEYTGLALQQHDFSPPSVLNDPNDWNHTWGAIDSNDKLTAYLSELVLITAGEESMPVSDLRQKRGTHSS